jgi:hypothetical protein
MAEAVPGSTARWVPPVEEILPSEPIAGEPPSEESRYAMHVYCVGSCVPAGLSVGVVTQLLCAQAMAGTVGVSAAVHGGAHGTYDSVTRVAAAVPGM